jgi:GNAT superfamily N-acetyltransferase
VIIRRATPPEAPELLAMRDEAAAWLTARGHDQWAEPWPDAERMAAGVHQSVAAGDVWVVSDHTGLVATLTLDTWPNPDLWTPHEANEPARYLHRLIVRRRAAGAGLGAELLDWCGTRAAHAGARWLRLDTWTTNRALQRYYLDHGFTHVRTRPLPHNPSGALFQRPARAVSTLRLARAGAVWIK